MNINALKHSKTTRKTGNYVAHSAPVQLVLHQFELHPGLKDLPKAGYRMDKLLWISR